MQKNPFELQAGESILRQEAGVLILGGLKNRMGRIFLSNQRLVFTKNNLSIGPMFGLLGVLIEHLIERLMGGNANSIVLDLPLSHILRYEHGQFGFNKKVIFFHARDGQVHKIGTNKSYEEWEADLKKVLKK